MSIFDRSAETYDHWYTTPLGKHVDETETRCAFELLRPIRGMRILDAGCGTGNFSLKLARLGCRATGVDVSKKMLVLADEKARRENLPAEFFTMNVCDLAFEDECFDAVISITAFEFIEAKEQAMKELLRTLKTGGRLLVGTINRESAWGELYRTLGEKESNVFRHAHLMSVEELRLLEPAHFVTAKECLFVPPNAADGDLCEEREKELGRDGRGGFLCALWKK